MSGPPMGNAHRFDRDGEANREAVLLALAKGPRTGGDLRDALAARCGGKTAVGRALHYLAGKGLIVHREPTWHLTQAGITEALRLVAERGKAAA